MFCDGNFFHHIILSDFFNYIKSFVHFAEHGVIAVEVLGVITIVTDEKLEVGPTGQIHGNVTAGSLAIASGAVIEGDMHMTEHDEPIHFEEKRSVA